MVKISHGCARLAIALGGDLVPHCPVCGEGPCTEYGDGEPPLPQQLDPPLEVVEAYLRTVNRLTATTQLLHYLTRDLSDDDTLKVVYEGVCDIVSFEREILLKRKAALQAAVLGKRGKNG
jgi:hypothetical protein